jgi:NADH:ubiquinone oxidoreductase subunit F (NADH-binding)
MHDDRSARSLALALSERRNSRLRPEPRFSQFAVPGRFVSGQSSALVNVLSGGPTKPTFVLARSSVACVSGRRSYRISRRSRTVALIARCGAAWFRELGTERDPGSTLVTLSGSVALPGVHEIDHAVPLVDLLDGAGVSEELTAVLLGGYFGPWLSASQIGELRLAPERLADHGATLGCRVIVALDAH